MAFRQPTHAPPRIHNSPISTPEEQPQTFLQPASSSQPPAEEEQWILFSAADSSTNRTYTATNTTATRRTAGRSRLSDFGSLDTAARSYDIDAQSEDDVAVEDDEEDGELDSLDSHLHEFRSEPSVYRRAHGGVEAVLPTHDGLGSFRVEREGAVGMGEDVQEHLYSFERYNPRRVKRRRESLEIGQLELENERAADAERMRRIELWRVEQSRLLVDEIQRESRRRKMSFSTERSRRGTTVLEREEEDLATLSTIGSEGDTHVVSGEDETFWNRVTRRVIRDLMGIDDDLLSIIFGESLPEDDDLSTTPPANMNRSRPAANSLVSAAQFDESSWEHKLLERIARELGILVNQISDHPGAFNTYLRTQQEVLPYAGLPIIPESARDHSNIEESPIHVQDLASTSVDPVFHPTIQQTQPLPIPQQSTTSFSHPQDQHDQNATPRAMNSSQHTITREEWEADLDISLVFSYLRNRFTSKFRSSTSTTSTAPPLFGNAVTGSMNTHSTPESTARAAAARVRQHHPLVSSSRETRERERRKSIERTRTWKASVPDGITNRSSLRPVSRGRRGSSSCASERGLGLAGLGGSRGVGIATSVGVRSGSSRHYWDFGPASVGSGSLVGGVGGGGGVLGSWGEV